MIDATATARCCDLRVRLVGLSGAASSMVFRTMIVRARDLARETGGDEAFVAEVLGVESRG